MKRILFVSIAFPPKGDPECIQAGRYFQCLSDNCSISLDVVTSLSPTLFMAVDKTLEKYANVKGQLIELPIYESKYINFLIRKIFPVFLSRPDNKMSFHWQWRKVVRRLAKKPDVVYSRSYPLSSAIMAKKLATYYNVPWVLHLSDPWTLNVLHNHTSRELSYHSRMERKCFELASIISLTSQETLLLYKKRYPALTKKMLVFPNVYDNDLVSSRTKPENSRNEKFRIVYTGGLANTRSAKPLLEALHRLHAENPFLSNQIEMIFAGDMSRENRKVFETCKLPSVRHLGLVSAMHASTLQKSANLLIVIDSQINDIEKAVFFPSKLMDYAILRIPILAITDKDSVTSNFVTDHGGKCFTHNEVVGMTNWLKSLLLGEIKIEMKELSREFSSQYQAERLIGIFNSIS